MNNRAALDSLAAILTRRLTLVDAGARWGVSERWDGFEQFGHFICFEPDREECDRLNTLGRPNTRYYPYALADRDGEVAITLTREPACSSVYPPLPGLYRSYPALGVITPVAAMTVPCRRLDSLAAEIGLERADVLKVDTQGSELDILKGAVPLLNGCSLVDIEVEFNELYGGQNLFHEVDAFLRDHGFVLWRLSELVHYKPEKVPDTSIQMRIACAPGEDLNLSLSGGQLFWGQAHYVRQEFPHSNRDIIPGETAVPAAFICGLYGYWDLALEILSKFDTSLPLDLAALLDNPAAAPDCGASIPEAAAGGAEKKICQMQAMLAAREKELAGKDRTIASLTGSRSWRMTAPLRAAGRLLSRFKKR